MTKSERIRRLNNINSKEGPIVYWMSRDQRIQYNWALYFAQTMATQHKQPLIVIFNIVPKFLGATWRQYDFMLQGLQEIEHELHRLGIPFYILIGNPQETIVEFLQKFNIGQLITDFSPLCTSRQWKKELSSLVNIPFYEVDTHNIIPCWELSQKQEFSARTIRIKVQQKLSQFLDLCPPAKQAAKWLHAFPKNDWQHIKATLRIDFSTSPIDWCIPGEKAGQQVLYNFIHTKLKKYDQIRNDPTQNGQSELSPYLHFGHISAQHTALQIMNCNVDEINKKVFLEELIVRKELSDNYCFYNAAYDQFNGFPAWGRKTLDEHRIDKREFLYNLEQFIHAKTHDDLWNAAQKQMLRTGKMHGFMRMYWAKKILEWTASPEEALSITIFLNDTYELDGRDPNGYVGIAWSLGGLHDRPWFERPVFGKIRYMNANGAARKFNISEYIKAYS